MMSLTDLEAEGWSRQFTVELTRVNEYVEIYEAWGNEVRVVPITPDMQVTEACADCLLANCDKYVAIYTRPKAAKPPS